MRWSGLIVHYQGQRHLENLSAALSKAVKRLERETELNLTEREGRVLVLTETGMRFLQTAEPLLHSWLNLTKDIQRPTSAEHFRFGSFEVFTTYF
jgi:DNA-binding transcriptional LysR family regulator